MLLKWAVDVEEEAGSLSLITRYVALSTSVS